MFIGEIINIFESECLENVLESRINEYGFDLIVKKGSYSSFVNSFIQRINTEKYNDLEIVDFNIIEWAVQPYKGNTLRYNFYDRLYFDPEGKTKRQEILKKRALSEEKQQTDEVKDAPL